MDMQVDPARSSSSAPFDDEPALDDARLDQMMRWHGTDETNLPPADTLKNLARDTVAALAELRALRGAQGIDSASGEALEAANATIAELRAAIGQAFWATDFRTLHAILLAALGPPPAEERPQ
jgi:hypothetical protein